MAKGTPFRKDFFDEDVGTKWIMFSFYEADPVKKLEDALVSSQELAAEAVSSAGEFTSRLMRASEGNTKARSQAEKSKEISDSYTEKLTKVVEKAQTKSLTTNVENYRGSIIMPMINVAQESSTQSFSRETGPVSSLLNGISKGAVDIALTASRTFSQLSGSTGIVLNSDYNSVYNGGDLRTFNASWDIIPKSEAEATRLFEVIQKFKEVSSPKKKLGALFLSAPMRCKIEFSNKRLNDTVKYTDMVITKININYSLTGFMETFRDGTPKAISISIDFQDSLMKTRDDWITESNEETVN